MAKVFIGVGHGGIDPGAVANGFQEKDLALEIAQECNAELVRHGVVTLMSRTTDENDTATEEVNECNAFAPDFAIDIHINAGGGDGVEAFHHYGGGKGKTLAENVLAEIAKLGQNSRGAKIRVNSQGKDYYVFIRETSCPAIILEVCFIDTKDIQFIDTKAKRKAVGVAVAKAILRTLNIAYKAVETSNSITFAELQKMLKENGYKTITV